jgi:CheY-like chemotaxis protein
VFQEFTQLGNPDRDRRKGLGLGLAIVERLARLLGHTVELRSQVGKGSMFALLVPRAQHDEQALLDSREGLTAHFDLGGRLVLVVAGNPADRNSITERLAAWNCDVLGAPSGAEMLASLGALGRPPDLIIVDEPDGQAVVEMLRNEFNADVPALLLSGGQPPGAHEGLHVLHKPFRPGQLRTLINNVLHAPVEQAQRRAS